MRMWMWFGYDLGEFLFPGLDISTRWQFALTWIVLFFTALLFEGSKVYLARVQREAQKKLYPYRSDERRNLLCDREAGNVEPTTSRSVNSGQVSRWAALRVRVVWGVHQATVFVLHNVFGYLLMLVVMLYNVHLLLAVVFGMMLGYFLFGTKLTRLQMQCFGTRRVVICTPECDDTAESTTPPLLDSTMSSESDLFICQTRTCVQPSHYFPAQSSSSTVTCSYGAKSCPSKVARAKKSPSPMKDQCAQAKGDKDENPLVEDVQLLRTERQGCCKQKQQPPPEELCCRSSQEASVVVHEAKQCCNREEDQSDSEVQVRENSPQITCCHSKTVHTDSQEQIIK